MSKITLTVDYGYDIHSLRLVAMTGSGASGRADFIWWTGLLRRGYARGRLLEF